MSSSLFGFLRTAAKLVAVLVFAIAVLIVVALWLVPPPPEAPSGGEPGGEAAASSTVWTCSMHPHVRLSLPGNCPICFMALIPASGDEDSGPGITLDARGRALARVETVPIARGEAVVSIETVGHFDVDERRMARFTAWMPGRIEKTHVPYVGAFVRAGDPLVDLYSLELPAMLADLRALSDLGEEARAAARERLLHHGLGEAQLLELEKAPSSTYRVTLRAPLTGVVMERPAVPGSSVAEGDLLASIVALDPLVLDVEVYERDLALVGPGAKLSIRVDALPEESFEGVVEYMKPYLTEPTRTVHARVLVRNPKGIARPEMFVRARFDLPLAADGLPLEGRVAEFGGDAPPAALPRAIPEGAAAPATAESAPASKPATQWLCPMKCEPPSSEPGRCSVCGMALREQPPEGARDLRAPLLLPASALLDLGKRRLVYVELEEGRYVPREVTLGPRVGDRWVVLAGLEEGERVVARGGFLIDSQTQIQGKASLLYEKGSAAGAAAGIHAGHGAPETEKPR